MADALRVFSPTITYPGDGGRKLSAGDIGIRRCLLTHLALGEVLSSLVLKRAVAGLFEASTRCAVHKRERVPVGIFSPGIPPHDIPPLGTEDSPLPPITPHSDPSGPIFSIFIDKL